MSNDLHPPHAPRAHHDDHASDEAPDAPLAADEAPSPEWLPPLGLGLLAAALLGWYFTRPLEVEAPTTQAEPAAAHPAHEAHE